MNRIRFTALAGAALIAAGTVGPMTLSAHADDPFGLGLPVPGSQEEFPSPVTAAEGTFAGGEVVLSPENNHLNAYSVETGERFRVISSAHDHEDSGRDINGQICVDPTNPARFVAGEDTGQGGGDAAGVAGWGFFELMDDSGEVLEDPQAGDLLAGDVDGLGATQIGKLAPAYWGTPDNHGCGFMSAANDHALITVTIGDILPGDEPNGEVLLWARDDDGGFGWDYTTGGRDGTQVNTPNGSTPYCKLLTGIPTAGGAWVDPETDDIYVAGNRPTGGDNGPLDGTPGGIWRLSSDAWPTYDAGTDTWTGCHTEEIDDLAERLTEESVADDGVVTVELVELQGYVATPMATVNPLAATPSGVVGSGRGTMYVSSVFTGTVMEYELDGTFVRPIVLPGEGAAVDGQITPFGLVVSSDGTLWVADIGQAAVTVLPFTGSLVKVPIVDAGSGVVVPGPALAIDRGLTYPDGLGVTTVTFD